MSSHEPVTDTVTQLSTWDQSTSRFHIRLVLCFRVPNSQRENVTAHLAATLDRLSTHRPDLAGQLHLGDRRGWICLRESPSFRIPFDTRNIEDEFGYTYEKLEEANFPAGAFVHPRFGYPGRLGEEEPPVPVAAVRAFYVDGGLLMATFLHHAFGDGECMLEFLGAFSGASREVVIPVKGTRSLEFTRGGAASKADQREKIVKIGKTGEIGNVGKKLSFEELLARCPEFTLTHPSLGPNQPTPRPGGPLESSYNKTGRVFVFSAKSIQGLKNAVQRHAPSDRPPSTYVVLASLMWAHAARARTATEAHEDTWGDPNVATLTVPVNWRRRAFGAASGGYFGNAAALARTTTRTSELLLSCGDEKVWAGVVRKLEREIRGVDADFVRRRVELFEGAGDPRVLGLVMDPRVGADLAFNTWREFGADTLWDIGVVPDGEVEDGVGNGIESGETMENGICNGVSENGVATDGEKSPSENGVAMDGEKFPSENGEAKDGEKFPSENGVGEDGRGGRRGVKPDKLRRSQDNWNMGGTLILPAREGSTDYEVLLTIPGPAMELLCRDWGFMRWVSGVPG